MDNTPRPTAALLPRPPGPESFVLAGPEPSETAGLDGAGLSNHLAVQLFQPKARYQPRDVLPTEARWVDKKEGLGWGGRGLQGVEAGWGRRAGALGGRAGRRVCLCDSQQQCFSYGA